MWRSGRADGDDDSEVYNQGGNQALGENRALTHGIKNAQTPLYPAQFLLDVQRIVDKARAEELCIVASTTEEKRLVARTMAYEEGNWMHFDEAKRFHQGAKCNAR